MAAKTRSTVVGVFEDRMAADRAVDELRRAGFREDQIGVAGRYEEDRVVVDRDPSLEEEASAAGTGAISGALAGAGLGALAGLGILAGVIPIVGPAIAGGTLGILLSNAAAGAGIAGLAGALIGAGVSEEEAEYYEGELKGGRTIVTVQADGRTGEAGEILRRHGAYDMQTRSGAAINPVMGDVRTSSTSTTTRSGVAATGDTCAPASSAHYATSHTERTTGAAPMHGSPVQARAATTGHEHLELREERLGAHTEAHKAGEVRVTKEIVTEHKKIEVPVVREEIVIERHAASGCAVPGSLADLKPGEEIRIPVKEEEVIVDKNTVVREEVSVGKRVIKDHETVEGDVRREELRVDRKGDVKVEDVTGDSSRTFKK
jgi:uncharacterized protein (TIGR02271 family)